MKKLCVSAVAVWAFLSAGSAMGQDISVGSTVALPPVPTVTVPALPPVPTVTAPTLPPVPTVTAPAVPQVPTTSTTQVPGESGLPAVSGVTGSPAHPGGSSGSSTGGGSGQSGGPASGGTGTGTGSAGADAPAGRAGTPSDSGGSEPAARAVRQRIRHERRLRTTVRRLEGCIGGLADLERRVLALRAGLGTARPQTRGRVARGLGLSPRRVTRLERHGLRTLKSLARGGHCGAVAAAPGPSAGDVSQLPAFATSLLGVSPLADRVEVKGELDSSIGSPLESALPPVQQQQVTEPARARVLGLDITLPLILILGAAGVAYAVRVGRRTLRPDPLA